MAFAVVLLCLVLLPYLSVLALAVSLTLVFEPLYQRLKKALHSGTFSALFIVLLVVLIVFIPLTFFGIKMIGEASSMYSSLSLQGGSDIGNSIMNTLNSNFPSLHLSQSAFNFSDSIRQGLSWVTGNIGSVFSGIGQTVLTLFLALLGLFYFLRDGEGIMHKIFGLVPLATEDKKRIADEMGGVMSSVMKGTIIVALIQGIAAGLGFWLFGVPNPVFWGAVVAVASPIPFIGPWLVILPAAGYLFLNSGTALSIGLIVWSVLTVNLIYNLVAPQLMHRGNNIHPYIILLSILGGMALFGPIGFLIGPLAAAFLFSLLSLYPKIILKKSE